MILIEETIRKEKNRIIYMISHYENVLKTLPKGTISENHIGDKTYYYLKYREGKKIISKYVPKADKEDLVNQIEKRKHIESMIKSLHDELKYANKALGEK